MNLFKLNLKKKFSNKKLIKIITGLNKVNIKEIIKKVKAAEIGGATYVDIIAQTDIVLNVKLWTNLPICVSSIDALSLYKCIITGADIVEIGNFDTFYDKNIIFSEKQILGLAKEIKLLLNKTKICTTIPHTISLSNQIQLAIRLKKIGIDMIQTEGISTKKRFSTLKYKTGRNTSRIFNSTYKASSALSSSYTLSKYIDLPIIASSGIDILSAPIAISYGASGIGLGSSINKFQNINDVANYIYEIMISCLGYNKISSINLESDNYLRFNKVEDSIHKVKII